MKEFFTKRPWILVVFAFIILIGAWSTFFYIAVNNQPEKIPLETETGTEEEAAGESKDAGN